MNPIERPEKKLEGGGMIEFSKDLEEKAIELAQNLSDDNIIALPVGEKREALWLSLNPTVLVPLYHIDRENEQTIYIGLKKEAV